MSKLQEYRSLEEQIRELTDKLDALSNDEKLQKEIEFEQKLRELMGQYGKSLKDVIAIIDPDNKLTSAPRAVRAAAPKRARKVKQYKNPHTGELVETKGGNHKTLKAWKQQYGNDTVESWMTIIG